MPLTHRVADVTPDLARSWLKNFNEKNRPLKPFHVDNLAREMSGGNWVLNGETVIFGSDDQLLDGQHRLHAIVESGVTVSLLLVEGVNPQTWETLGRGNTRTAGDVLGREKFVNPVPLAATARTFHRYRTGGMRSGSAGRNQLSNALVLELVRNNPDLIKSLDAVLQYKTQIKGLGLGQGLIAGLFAEFTRIDALDAQQFLTGLALGVGLSEGSPILLLRIRLQDSIHSRHGIGIRARLNEIEKAALVIKAWNFFRRNESIKYLRWTGSKGTAKSQRGREKFPTAE